MGFLSLWNIRINIPYSLCAEWVQAAPAETGNQDKTNFCLPDYDWLVSDNKNGIYWNSLQTFKEICILPLQVVVLVE